MVIAVESRYTRSAATRARRWLAAGAIALLGLAAPALHAADAPAADTNEAIGWWIESAEQGNAELQYGLAKLYEIGAAQFGIEKDEAQAAKWFERAAAQGHAKAQYALARAYEEGRGVARNRAQALAWYGKAAESGYVPAEQRLAALQNRASLGGSPATASVRAAAPTSMPAGSAGYWSWWQGALALGFVAVAFWYVVGAPLGVSSSWDRVVHWREEQARVNAERRLHADRGALEEALLAETMAQFGAKAVAQLRAGAKAPAAKPAGTTQVPWPVHLTFLSTLGLGGLLAAVTSGEFQLRWDLGAEHVRMFGSGWQVWSLLLAGGFLVGFGTRMAGGCTSGHGLAGCARLQPGSLLATAAFFGTAVLVSIAMEMMVQ
jgi:hypothetical protein